MAIDPQAPPGPVVAGRPPAIENEIPAYRAISARAIVSLLLGIGSLLTFASWAFAALGLGAVVLGFLADRAIRRHPDMLTGRGLARAGITLGMVFSLSALTFDGVRHLQVRRSAEQFARRYARVLRSRRIEDAFWLALPPTFRKGTTPRTRLVELESDKAPGARDRLAPLRGVLAAVERSGRAPEFVCLEEAGFERLTPYAFAVLAVHTPAGPGTPPEQYALLELKSDSSGPAFNWFVSEVQFPYTLRSHELAPPPIDDGHGHAH